MHASPWVLLKRLHTKCFPPWIRRRSYLYFLTCVYSFPPKKVAATKIDRPVPLVYHMLILNVYCNGHSYPSLAQGPESLYTFRTSEKSVCVYLINFQVPDPSFTTSIFCEKGMIYIPRSSQAGTTDALKAEGNIVESLRDKGENNIVVPHSFQDLSPPCPQLILSWNS